MVATSYVRSDGSRAHQSRRVHPLGQRPAVLPSKTIAALSSSEQTPAHSADLARRGTLWAIIGHGTSVLIRFGGNIILTRLLTPDAFGVMTIVNSVIIGLFLFSDVGVGPSVIQGRREDVRFLDTAWTIQVARGVLLTTATALSGLPLARAYGDPVFIGLMPAAAISVLVSSLHSTNQFTQNRELAIGRLTAIEIASQLAGLVAMIASALVYHTVWALVANNIVAAIVKTTLTHVALPGIRNRFDWDPQAARGLFRFGRWIFFGTILTFLAGHTDRLIFAGMIPIDQVGIYSIGQGLALFPLQVLINLARTIAFPLYSRHVREHVELGELFHVSRRRLLVLGGWPTAGLLAGGRTVMLLLYEPTYEDAGWMMQVLAAGFWFNILEATTSAAVLAYGRSVYVTAGNAAKLVGMLVLIPLGYRYGGFVGALVGYAASEIPRYATSAIAATTLGLRVWKQDLGFTLLFALSSAAGWFAGRAADAAGLPIAVAALIVFVVVTLAWTPVMWRVVIARGGPPSSQP